MKHFDWRVLLWGGLLGLVLAACSTVPVTGRKQLNLVGEDQMVQLGLSEFDKMKQEMPISDDPKGNAMLQEVGRRIAAAAAADLPDAKWEFVLFKNDEPNAFCLPGGKVGVYTGILPIAQNESGLATVIGHEVAHAAAHHGAERMSEEMVLQTGGQVIGAGLSNSSATTQQAVNTLYGLGAQLGLALPHSRKQEAEADHLGLVYMARAGYNPQEALTFWKRFAEATSSEGGGPWFLRTHPLTADRITDIQKEMPEAMSEFQRIHPGAAAVAH